MANEPTTLHRGGDCVATLVDGGLPTERVVVTKADPLVLASPQLVAEWRTGTNRVQLECVEGQEVVRFGTEGEGLGVVAYEIGEPPTPGDWAWSRTSVSRTRWDTHEVPTIPLWRVQ